MKKWEFFLCGGKRNITMPLKSIFLSEAAVVASTLVLGVMPLSVYASNLNTTAPNTGESSVIVASNSNENTSSESASSEEKGKEFGRVEDTTYINDFFGVAFDAMDDWTFSNEEELSSLNGYTSEKLSDVMGEDVIDGGGAIIDFYATDSYSETISLNISSLDSVISVIQSNMISDEDFILKISEYMTDSVADSMFSAMGVDEGSGSLTTGTVEFLGAETPCIRITATFNGVDFYETEVFLRNGGYYATITAATFYEDYATDVLAGFYSTEISGALTSSDFKVLVGNELVDMIDYCTGGYADLVYYDPETDPSRQGVLRTARGIHLGDSLNKVVAAYGETNLYNYAENAAVFSDYGFDFEDVTSFAIYDYQGDEGEFIIIFFYDSNNEVDSVFFETEDIPDRNSSDTL